MCVYCASDRDFSPAKGNFGVTSSGFGRSGESALAGAAVAAELTEQTDAAAGTSTTYTMGVGDSFKGVLSFSGDNDWIGIDLVAGKTYIINLRSANSESHGQLFNPELKIADASGNIIGSDSDSGDEPLAARVVFTVQTTGKYYLVAASSSSTLPFDDRQGGYKLDVAERVIKSGTLDERADFLTHGGWNLDSSHSGYIWDTSDSNVITFNITGLTEDGKKLARMAFKSWEAVVNLKFSEITTKAQITIDDEQSGAFATPPQSGETSGDINVSKEWLQTYGTKINEYVFGTYIHEIGHALGLGHQGDYNGQAEYGVDNNFLEDSWQTSVMSYFDQRENTRINASKAYYITPMMVDIIAIQNLYGAPDTSSITAGDTVYGKGANLGNYMDDFYSWFIEGKSSALFKGATPASYNLATWTIYDHSGTDSFDFSPVIVKIKLDMNPENFSDFGGFIGVMGIARGTIIENAKTGSGNDHIIGNEANNEIYGGAGNDTIIGGDGHDTLYGEDGDDILEGEDGDDVLYGGAGNDIFKANAGDTVHGGAGTNDIIELQYSATQVRRIDGDTEQSGTLQLLGADGSVVGTVSFTGIESIRYAEDDSDDEDVIIGTSGDDTIDSSYVDPNGKKVTDGDDEINAKDGSDTVRAGGGGDTVWGMAGNDHLYGEAGDDVLYGGDGNDDLYGGDGDDELSGHDDIDILRGGAGRDNLSGGNGRDFLYGDAGRDILYGGNDNDDLYGGDDNDEIYGGDGDDKLYGNDGNDILDGNLGNDTVEGGAGDDEIYGGAGDTIDGGTGSDTLKLNGLGKITFTNYVENSGVKSGTVNFVNDAGEITGSFGFSNIEEIIHDGIYSDGSSDGVVSGTSGRDFIDEFYEDTDGDKVNDEDNVVRAGAGHDFVFGLDGDDEIYGGDGNDTLYGNQGNDTLEGEAGDDYLYGGKGGNNILKGGDGRDFLLTRTGEDTLYGGAGQDLVFSGSGKDTLHGGDDNDNLWAGGGNDVVNGDGGDDFIKGDSGDDTLNGGAGGDTIFGDSGDDRLDGGEGSDRLYGGSGNDEIIGGAGDTIDGGEGHDVLNLEGLGTTRLKDVIQSDGSQSGTIEFLDTSGVVQGSLTFKNIERFRRDGGVDAVVSGTGGDDIIDASYTDSNNDKVSENADVIEAGAGNDTVSALGGNDVIYGGDGDDTLNGGSGNDLLYGGKGSDTLNGGDGDDEFFADAADNSVDGGAGNDILNVMGKGRTQLENIVQNDGTQSGTLKFLDANGNITGSLTFSNIEEIRRDPIVDGVINGTDGDDYITRHYKEIDGEDRVGSGDDVIRAGDGNDFIFSGDGEDTIYGGNGNDYIDAGKDKDILYGNAGDDFLNGRHGDDELYGEEGQDVLSGGLGNDLLNGGAGDDDLYGGRGLDEIHGGEGNDLIAGWKGNDTIYGDDGDDFILGGADDDTLYGGNGNDIIYAGSGNDTIAGGDGDDIITGSSGGDIFIFGNGNDIVKDFSVTEGDKLNFKDSSEITDYADLMANHIRQNGNHVEIFDNGGNVLVLHNILLDSITAETIVG